MSLSEDVFSNLPDFLQYSDTTGVMTVFSKDVEDAGTVKVSVNATLANLELSESGQSAVSQDNLIYTAGFSLTVTVLSPGSSYQAASNTAPYLVSRPSKLTAYIGRSFYYYFGEVHDLENDRVTVSIDLGKASSFAKFDPQLNTLTIDEGATTLSDSRLHEVLLTLVDQNDLSTAYEFTLALEEVYSAEEESSSLESELFNFHGVVTTAEDIFKNITSFQDTF